MCENAGKISIQTNRLTGYKGQPRLRLFLELRGGAERTAGQLEDGVQIWRSQRRMLEVPRL